jgi:hypothetical protein
MYGKRGSTEGVVDAGPARPAWHGESYTALSPVLRGRHGRPEVGTPKSLSCPLLVSEHETQAERVPQQSSEDKPFGQRGRV